MGKRFLRTVTSEQTTIVPSTDIIPVDLPVNPLSFLVLTIGLNNSVNWAITASETYLDQHFAMIPELSIRHRGETIIQGSLADIAMASFLLTGVAPWGREFTAAPNTVRTRSFIIPFGRKPYSHTEAFPATQRGNLRFHMSAAALPVSNTLPWYSLEAVELIEDNPTQFLKYTTLSRIVPSTGRSKFQLPIGNDLLGILLWDALPETGSPMTYGFGKVKLMKDNIEQYFGSTNWESLAADLAIRGKGINSAFGHSHYQAAADTDTSGPIFRFAGVPPLQYGYLDFDPLQDDSYALETAGAASLDLDMDADAAGSQVRILPIEMIKIPGAAGA